MALAGKQRGVTATNDRAVRYPGRSATALEPRRAQLAVGKRPSGGGRSNRARVACGASWRQCRRNPQCLHLVGELLRNQRLDLQPDRAVEPGREAALEIARSVGKAPPRREQDAAREESGVAKTHQFWAPPDAFRPNSVMLEPNRQSHRSRSATGSQAIGNACACPVQPQPETTRPLRRALRPLPYCFRLTIRVAAC